ncbi:unnamed protein product [Effrenium voratum]|nr:unnamed protein product [Effrenium voratum]
MLAASTPALALLKRLRLRGLPRPGCRGFAEDAEDDGFEKRVKDYEKAKMKWLPSAVEPMDDTGLAAQRRLQELIKRRDRLQRQLEALKRLEADELTASELEQLEALEDQLQIAQRRLSDTALLIKERKQEQRSARKGAGKGETERPKADDGRFGRLWVGSLLGAGGVGLAVLDALGVLQLQLVRFSLSPRMRKGHRAWAKVQKGRRRPRDALPLRQSQLNLAWARASSRHLREQSRIRRTLKMLQELLRDPVLAKELEHVACQPEVLELGAAGQVAAEAVVEAVRRVLGEEVSLRRGPFIGVQLERPLTHYDRNDLAMVLEDLGFEAHITRHGVTLRVGGRDLEVRLGLASELEMRMGGVSPFPVSHLTVSEDWEVADRRGQEQLRSAPELRWAVDLARRFSGGPHALPGLQLRGKRQRGGTVLELVLRQLVLRIQDRDAQSLNRFTAALATQGEDFQAHSLGSQLMVSMAREMLEWSKSGVLGLWLKDAELFAGATGKQQASRLLSAAATHLEAEVWGLGHTQSCPLPREDSLEASVDRSITKGVRLVHLGCLEEAQQQLGEADELLTRVPWTEVHQRLSLAATLTSTMLKQRQGTAPSRDLAGRCAEEVQRLEQSKAQARPLACWHNLPLLLRSLNKQKEPKRQPGSGYEDLWPNMEAAGADEPPLPTGAPDREAMHRSRALMSRLMPYAGRRADDLELLHVQQGLARILP